MVCTKTASLISLLLIVAEVVTVASTDVSTQEVEAAQKAWGIALVNISTIFDNQGLAAAKAEAERVIDAAYGYQIGPVLFKPTLASGSQTFRTTRAGALAYFVGNDSSYPSDTGFALKHWRNFSIENAAIFLNGSTGTSMGNVILIDKDGTKTVVDKTWTFLKDSNGILRIMLHHSSLPFNLPEKGISEADVVAAQKAWGDGLVSISTIFDTQGLAAAKAEAGRMIDAVYGYQLGPVLFKPTLAYGSETFRTTRAGALAYFVGDDAAFPTDTGFALKHWVEVKIENAAIFLTSTTGTSVGNVKLKDKSGNVTVVDKTWQFLKDSDGRLRIMAHHSSLPYQKPSSKIVTADEVRAAQKAWGTALVNISLTYEAQGLKAAKILAGQVVDSAYGYKYGPVLFKPTLASGDQTFRTTREGALAYFVGGDPNFPSDTGFALKGWRKVEINNSAIFIDGNTATTVGWVILTDKDGGVTKVDKTWTFWENEENKLLIVSHHSSLPYTPPVKADMISLATVSGWSRFVAVAVATAAVVMLA